VGSPAPPIDFAFFCCDAQAAGLGNKAEVPLGLNTRDLVRHSEISRGTQSVVYKGLYENQRVAIKTAKIGKAADLDNFKLEVVVMSKLRHVPSVVSLVAARLVPPGASLSVACSARQDMQCLHLIHQICVCYLAVLR